jgi:hypothetical protein
MRPSCRAVITVHRCMNNEWEYHGDFNEGSLMRVEKTYLAEYVVPSRVVDREAEKESQKQSRSAYVLSCFLLAYKSFGQFG